VATRRGANDPAQDITTRHQDKIINLLRTIIYQADVSAERCDQYGVPERSRKIRRAALALQAILTDETLRV
jgi:hypothetical protein